MTPYERELSLKVIDGTLSDAHTLQAAKYVRDIYMHRRCEEILLWLIEHRFTGKNFIAFVRNVHEGSPLFLIAGVLMVIDRDKKMKPIYAGKDFRIA